MSDYKATGMRHGASTPATGHLVSVSRFPGRDSPRARPAIADAEHATAAPRGAFPAARMVPCYAGPSFSRSSQNLGMRLRAYSLSIVKLLTGLPNLTRLVILNRGMNPASW